ncbi:hypothetical protein CTA2_12763, partial [Colletotrichum tanaceti]
CLVTQATYDQSDESGLEQGSSSRSTSTASGRRRAAPSGSTNRFGPRRRGYRGLLRPRHQVGWTEGVARGACVF